MGDISSVFTYYYYVDMLAVAVMLFTGLLIHRYRERDSSVRRNCLPIACMILIVLTSMLLLEAVFLSIKTSAPIDKPHPAPVAPPANKYLKP